MSNVLQRVWAEVNLDNIVHNIREIRRITSNNSRIMAVVKADAYGHGFLEVARTALQNGADYLAVAFLNEAKQLRESGVDEPILILGFTEKQYIEELIDLDITQTVFDYTFATNISKVATEKGKCAKIHIKIDTGMNRLGFKCNTHTAEIIQLIAKLPGIDIEGIFTHFASADEMDKSYTKYQFDKFIQLCDRLKECGIDIPIKHVCNSGGIIQYPNMHLDMVRAGIMLYGLYPSTEVDRQKISLKPAMQLKTVVALLKEVDEGVSVSYGRIYTTQMKTTIATLPVGYADGYSRILSGKAKVIIRDKIVPVIGRICMDYCMADVTEIEGINEGDEVILFGQKGEHSISTEDIAEAIGTNNYEVVCMVGKRVPRIYTKNY